MAQPPRREEERLRNASGGSADKDPAVSTGIVGQEHTSRAVTKSTTGRSSEVCPGQAEVEGADFRAEPPRLRFVSIRAHPTAGHMGPGAAARSGQSLSRGGGSAR